MSCLKRVLIAEDETAIREIIGITLKRAGYEVTEACDGKQALDIYNEREGNFDVVLLDIMMPKMDGLEMLKKLKDNSTIGHIPVMMLTAVHDEQAVFGPMRP